MTILDRQMIARILAMPGFGGVAAPGAQDSPRELQGRTMLPWVPDRDEHDGWQSIRPRSADPEMREDWWVQ